jgi:hypothetical protein
MTDNDVVSATPKKHDFNDRMFCKDCGADAIGLRGWGKDAMKCPFIRPGVKRPEDSVNA